MRAARRSFTCLECRLLRPQTQPQAQVQAQARTRVQARAFHGSRRLLQADAAPDSPASSLSSPPSVNPRPAMAPKAVIDIKHIRQNPTVHEQNCLDRNYRAQAGYPERINVLHEQWQARQRDGRALRERSNLLRRWIANPATTRDDEDVDVQQVSRLSREEALEEARVVKRELSTIEADEDRLTAEIEALALAVPNLTSEETPRGDEPLVLSYINDHPEPEPKSSDRVWRSHVHIGTELGLLDFAAAGTASGWGWYYLLDEAAQLEQALVQHALTVASRHGWRQVSPPSMVYSHIAAACGFQPRDQNGEQQIYSIAQSASATSGAVPGDPGRQGRPEMCLAGTAEISLAGMKTDSVLEESDLPAKRVAVSRSYRAEAGARGADTKGLYRVHEFTKVEMFAWTEPSDSATAEVFDEILDIQTELLGSLGLHCRVLEMPSTDLGASAARKCDIEAFFPSRRGVAGSDGWGEVTSASVCTDYQTRRLATRLRDSAGRLTYPWTVNGTALAVPRVLAALLENGWDEGQMTVAIPECLRPWMDGKATIGPKHRHT